MKRNGKTKAGKQRWRYRGCGSSATHSISTDERDLKAFLSWLLSKEAQADMPGQGRTFRRRTSRFWGIWPMPEATGEAHKVVYVDGIYLARNVCVLIACSDEHVLAWYLCRAETARRLEGAHGLRRAARGRGDRRRQRLREGVQGGLAGHAGAEVRVPRLLPVKRYTTSRPNLQAGVELYALARELLHLETLAQAQWWRERFVQWCGFWCDFLEERSTVDGRSVYTHEGLRKARSGLVALSNQGTLFAYLDPALSAERPLPATNNRIEGGVNAPLRSMLRNHRGMSVTRRIKAVFWWCYMRTEYRLPASQILARMPTDDDVDMLYELYGSALRPDDGAPQWGDGLVWNEFHHATAYPYAVD